MQVSNAPTAFPIPFANGAGAGYTRTIPQASQIGVTPGAASLTDGFPPLNFLPVSAGGVPPFGQDMNGILYETTLAAQWLQAGWVAPYNSTFSTAIGGYPKGALISKAANNGFWLCTADNNTTNPDTGGANWLDPFAGRLLNVQIFASSTTYTATTGTNSIIVEQIGGGGGGGGSQATSSGSYAAATGGTGGTYAKARITSGFSGSTVTIGAAGSAGAAGNNGGGTGGTTSFTGTFGTISCPGGFGGNGGAATSTAAVGAWPASPASATITGATAIENQRGQMVGFSAIVVGSGTGTTSGQGANSRFGAGGAGVAIAGTGNAASGFGAGGSGGCTTSGGPAAAGGAGGAGYVIVWEYA